MLGKYDCPEFNTLVKGKPRFIVNPKKFDKDDPSKGIHLRLKSGYQIPAEPHHISRLRKTISDYLLDRYRILNETQLQDLIDSLQEHCAKADQKIRLKLRGSKEGINSTEFETLYPNQYKHIATIMEARENVILQYKSVTNSKDIESLLVKPINFKVRFTAEELLVILGTMIQKNILQVLEIKREISKKQLSKLLADYVGILTNRTDLSVDWDMIDIRHVSTFERQNAYKDHFDGNFRVDDDEIWINDESDLGNLLTALLKYSPTKKGV